MHSHNQTRLSASTYHDTTPPIHTATEPTGKIKLTQSATRYYRSLPPSFLPPNEAWPPFVYAVGKGESPMYEVRAK